MATVNPYIYRLPDTPVFYPDSDGEPMAESDFQLHPLIYAINALRAFFADRPDVYVAGNMFVYYEEDNPKAVVAPDVFVVFGAPNHDRSSYKVWEGGKAPDFVLEITSLATRTQDQGPKRGIYAYMGVREYFQADPTGDYLKPPLQGQQLAGDQEAVARQVVHLDAYLGQFALIGIAGFERVVITHCFSPFFGVDRSNSVGNTSVTAK